MSGLFVYIESDDALHYVCLGTEEFDENPFIIWRGADESAANAQALMFANKLREGGAKVQLH